jgi:site-specific recombinase XerD
MPQVTAMDDQFGTHTLQEITPQRLTRFLTTSYSHLAPASYNRVVATLGSLFAYTTRQDATDLTGGNTATTSSAP